LLAHQIIKTHDAVYCFQLTMAAVVEVTFDAQKHINVSKGSIVGEDGGIGYLVYPMPPAGTFDLSTDKELLKNINQELIGCKGGDNARAGSPKTLRKAREKAVRRAFLAYLGQ